MANYDYLIIGGGMTAGAGVDGIREVDPTAQPGPFTPKDLEGLLPVVSKA